MGPCAKVVVRCTLIGTDGRRWIGYNDCRRPQAVCPREKGEGYDKCKLICDQQFHAETDAIDQAGPAAVGGVAYIEFLRDPQRPHVCPVCREAMKGMNITWHLGAPPNE